MGGGEGASVCVSRVCVFWYFSLTHVPHVHLPQRQDMFMSMIRNVIVAVFHGSLYTDLSPGAIQSRLSLLFFAIMFVMMANQAFIPK